MRGLTERHQEILDFIRAYVAEHGYPPTLREIDEPFGFSHQGTVTHLNASEGLTYFLLPYSPSALMGVYAEPVEIGWRAKVG